MKFGYLNIGRKLIKKIAVIEDILIRKKYDILSIAEIDLDRFSSPPSIQGFTSVVKRNSDGLARICLYIRSNLSFDVQPVDGYFPGICIQLAQCTLAAAYCEFTEDAYTKDKRKIGEKERCNRVIDFLDQVAFSAKNNLCILGDMNIDWFSKTISKKRLVSWCIDHSCTQLITSTTRKATRTCLDLAFCRMPRLYTKSDVFESGISDHQGIHVTFGRDKEKTPRLTVTKWNFTCQVRDFAREHKLDIKTLNNLSTEEIAKEIINWLTGINNMCTDNLTISSRRAQNPWYNKNLSSLRADYIASSDSSRIAKRNIYTRAVRKAKTAHVRHLAKSLKGGVWSVIKRNTTSHAKQPHVQTSPDKCSTSDIETANAFKAEFEGKIKRLQKTAQPNDLLHVLPKSTKNWDLTTCSPKDVADAVDRLKPTGSSGGNSVTEARSARDLGIIIDENCNSSEHVNKIARKAHAMLSQMKRATTLRDSYTFMKLYTTYCRPLLEFAAPAWNPSKREDIETLEKVQRRALRMISDLGDLNYEERLERLGLQSLEDRRKRGDLIETYKTLNGKNDVDVECWFDFVRDRHSRDTRSREADFLISEKTRLDVRKHFFKNRVTNDWNNLPIEIRTAQSTNSFKNYYDEYLRCMKM